MRASIETKMSAAGDKYRWWVLATIFIGTFMAPLDSSIVNIAIPTLAGEFSVGITTVQWVVLAYLLTVSSLLLSAGRLGDIRGHKPVYITGFLLFTTASMLCGFAGSIQQLIFFRALQALGGACMLATAPAILTAAFPPNERGKALGVIGISVAVGLTIGPSLGGFIVGTLGWRWIFFVNLPVGIVASTMALFILKPGKRDPEKRFDYAGSVTAFAALLLLLLALSKGNSWGWGSLSTLGLLGGAAALLGLFVVVERRVREPMLDLTLFKIRLFSAANLSALINFVGLFVVIFLIPFYLEQVFHQSPQRTGMVLMAVPLATAIIAPIAGTLSDKIGSRMLSSAGLAVNSLALLGLSQTSSSSGVFSIVALLLVVGFGSGMFQSPNTSAILGAVPRNRLGIASGMQATMRNVGMVLGVAIAAAIVATYAPGGPEDPNLGFAIHLAFIAGAAITAVGVVASLVRGGAEQKTAVEPRPQ